MVSNATLVVVVDNKSSPGLRSEWGWSAYIESPSWRILFDAGGDPSVIEYNMGALGINPVELDFAVLSHHHGDHCGGFEFIGHVHKGLKVYVPPGDAEYLREWGLEPVVVKNSEKVADDAWIVGAFKSSPLSSLWEIAFAFRVDGKGLVVVVGCSHPGVEKFVEEAVRVSGEKEVYMVIGGFHSASRRVIDRLASRVKYIGAAHCSGDELRDYIKRRFIDKYVPVHVGLRLVF